MSSLPRCRYLALQISIFIGRKKKMSSDQLFSVTVDMNITVTHPFQKSDTCFHFVRYRNKKINLIFFLIHFNYLCTCLGSNKYKTLSHKSMSSRILLDLDLIQSIYKGEKT